MSDSNQKRYIPSWCDKNVQRTPRTRFKMTSNSSNKTSLIKSEGDIGNLLKNRLLHSPYPDLSLRNELHSLSTDIGSSSSSSGNSQNESRHSGMSTPIILSSSNINVGTEESVDLDNIINSMKITSQFEFIYLTSISSKVSANNKPYSYRVTSFNRIAGSFYLTISNNGVITHDGPLQYFTPLCEWQRDFYLYKNLIKIKFFSSFRITKSFLRWKKIISHCKRMAAMKFLQENCFFVITTMRETHYLIVNRCLKMNRTSFPELSKVENFILDDFLLLQIEKLTLVIDNLNDFNSEIVDHIYYACSNELEKQESLRLKSKKRVLSSHQNSIELSYLEQINRKRLCSKLCRYIYLVSIVVNGMYCNALRTSYHAVYKAFRRHIEFFSSVKSEEKETKVNISQHSHAPQWPFFKIKLIAEETSLTLNPSPSEFIEAIKRLLNHWATAVLNLPKLSSDPKLIPFTRPLIYGSSFEAFTFSGPSLQFSIESDDYIKKQGNEILSLMNENFKAIDDYLDNLTPIHQFHIENLHTRVEDVTFALNPSLLRDHLQKFHFQIDAVRSVADQQSLGLFLLQLDEFKSEILPLSTEMLKAIEQTIPALGSQKIQQLSKECVEAMSTLQREPKNTVDTVAYLEFMASLSLRFDIIDEQVKYVDEIYQIVKDFKVPCGNDDLEAHANFKTQLTLLKNLSKKIWDEKEDIVAKLNRQIEKDIINLASEILAINDETKQDWLMSEKSNAEECVVTLHLLSERLMACQKRAADIRSHQKKFQLTLAEFVELDVSLSELKMRQLLWETYEAWNNTLKEYRFGDFNSLDPDIVYKFVAQTLKSLNQIDKYLGENEITMILKNDISSFQKRIPILVHLRNPALKTRHWTQVETMLNRKFVPGEPFNLDTLETCAVLDHVHDLEVLAGQASSEAGLESLLKKVESQWQNLELPVANYRDSNDTFILGGLDEVQQVLDDSFININTIISSKHVGPIKTRVQTWHKSLVLFSKTLYEWSTSQTNWLNLESIFSTPDIQRQLPIESRLFLIVDRAWKDIMRRTKENSLAMQAVTIPGTLEALDNNNKLIDQILKCLEAYLESKRLMFPRFYFISNEELLKILAQTRNPLAVQPHLGKCFDAIKELEFASSKGSSTLDITAMISHQGEKVTFHKVIKARGNVEDWLCKVEDFMIVTLKKEMKNALSQHAKVTRRKWIFDHPSQIILAASQIIRCSRIHSIFDESNQNCLDDLINFQSDNLKDLNMLAEMVRGSLTPLNRATLCSLITIDVHAKDTISHLLANKVTDSGNFEWQKCLRYYWLTPIEECVVKIATSCMAYGYEYLGASPRLVLTPLTDKCYLCLMGAMQQDLGGSLSGPPGTDKTETTKDLAKALALHCVVFNCSQSLDYKIMGKFLSGLAQAGSWCCFAEFDRIGIEVLSVIAQQLLTIRNAKVAKLSRFMFEGREISLQSRCAVFITMNPGYAGRTELPDNLKALFRPMAMMIPDYALIAEVVLYSEGFMESKILANKMTQLYKLCSEQLSQQNHYDFGMRALKSVLAMAGRLKRNNQDVPENLILIRALKDSNEPKFVSEDNILFQGIIMDLFPFEIPSSQNYGILEKAIRDQLIDAKLQPEACIIQKVIQLYETMVVRHGIMLVGTTGGGKTIILKTLKNTLTQLHSDGVQHPDYLPVRTYIMNPKAITIEELYGVVDILNLEWKDGILGMAVRNAVQTEDKCHHWIVCDSPVDPDWIENLNTVLDDNKTLCLANSERILLKERMCMVFEVQDLDQASPATVSRCGIIYVDPKELKWLSYVKSWLTYRIPSTILTDEQKVYLLILFEVHVTECLQFVSKHCTCSVYQVDLGKITTLCDIFHALILKFSDTGTKVDISRKIICLLFAFSLLWAVGGNIDGDGRPAFQTFIKTSFNENPDVSFNDNLDLWDVFIDDSGSLVPWTTLVSQFIYDSNVPFFDILVPTVDTVRYSFLMAQFLSVSRGVSFIGKTGVGKSAIANSVISELNVKDGHVALRLSFSALTSSFKTQKIMEAQLDKKRKNLLGAPLGKKVHVFIDDVNMPCPDLYGSQPPIELLRQYLDYGGFYDREKLYWKDICDVVICTACGPPGGGRNHLSPRFMRHFALLAIQPASNKSLTTIFKSILVGFFADFTVSIQNLAEDIVNCAISIFRKVESVFLPTPSKSHYIFNLKDLSKCFLGVLQARSATFTEPIPILRLFYHECLRVFQDRLSCIDDKFSFLCVMKEMCNNCFGTPILDFGDNYSTVPTLMFGDFITKALNQKDYEEIPNLDKIKNVLEENKNNFNLSANEHLELVLFQDALEHCCRIARILRTERGNGLLVGVSGMGKQSLTKLASHLNGYRCFQIYITQNYSIADFQNDLRSLYWSAGIDDTPNTFLISDNQIIFEEFLENINNILNTGEIPNLFEGEELEKVIQGFRSNVIDISADASRDDVFKMFISRAKRQLHIIIAMSPVGDDFRRRCRMFPSLVNSCTIDWFLPWPNEALFSVANEILRDTVNDALGAKIYPVCVDIHTASEKMSIRLVNEKRRYFYCSPSSYLQLLTVFKQMLTLKSDEIKTLRDRFSNGLQKLYETNSVVETMKTELVAYEPLLAKKSEATSELMKCLSKEQAAADHVRHVVVADEAIAKSKATETQLLADDAQKDLASALPAMESAMKSLDALNKTDIGELKVFNKPPNLVKVVMEAVCLLFSVKQDWGSAKVLLSDVNFLKRLREFDKDHLNDSMLKILRAKYIDHPDFVPDKVATQSKVCRSLCMWVRAIDAYAKVFKIVEPKRRALEVAESELNTIMGILREKQKKLAEVEGHIASLEAELDSAVAEKRAVEDAMSLTAIRLNRSSRLTTALGDEQTRWEEQVQIFTEKLHNMVGDILLSAGSVAYIGTFPSDLRTELTATWIKSCENHEITVSKDFSVITSLSDAYEIRSWGALGLPEDTISAENAVLVTRSGLWPLMIDPQGQANRWVRGLEGPRGLRIVRSGDTSSHNVLAAAIRTGSPVLIEDIGESIEPSLMPLLQNQIFIKGGVAMIQFCDSEIEYDKNFKLYLTTKLQNPHYLPEICILVTLINFSITIGGIEEQLLSEVVRLERPDLESTRSELITRINSDKLQLKNTEEKILRLLFGATGNILDDEELIDTLNESRETTEVTAARLEEAEITENRISVARDRYRPVATRGAITQSTVLQLSSIEPMYQFSIAYLSQIFCSVVSMSDQSLEVEEKVSLLMNDVTLAIFNSVSRGLFERHKLLFAFLLCTSIERHSGVVPNNYYKYFLRGPKTNFDLAQENNPYDGLEDTVWNSVNLLAKTFLKFEQLPKHLSNINFTIGQHVFKNSVKESANNDFNWNSYLDDFEKILIIKVLKEENLIAALLEYIKTHLGPSYVESPSISLNSLYEDTSNLTPLIFLLSSGSDPFSALQKFSTRKGFSGKLQTISLGQGQWPIAEKMITNASQRGDWIFLQNCHLAISWMDSLERKYQALLDGSEKVHSDFRLFLSSMPFADFPITILQNAVKVTNEPPRGIRANLHRSLSQISKDFFEDSPLQKIWRNMVYGLCFFHAFVQERRNFGALGWNIPYEFNDSDLEIALSSLRSLCIDFNIPWDALQYISSEVIYGGRVTDPWDLRCIKTALLQFFSPKAIESDYKYSSSGIYFCPESPDCCTLKAYQQYVESLPLDESAEVFGLSGNANTTYKTHLGRNLTSVLLELEPKGSEQTGKSTDDIVYELTSSIQSKLIDQLNVEDISYHITKKDATNRISPFSTILFQEVARYNNLLLIIKTTLNDLKNAISGEVVMSQLLEDVYTSFLNNKIPKSWVTAAYPSLMSLGSWVKDLTIRIDFITNWLKNGPPASFWIPGFFFPQGFLTASIQIHSRQFQIPIDQLQFQFKVLDSFVNQEDFETINNLNRPEFGVCVHGLYLEAGRWNLATNHLEDPLIGEMLSNLPVLWLLPKQHDLVDTSALCYKCPLYKTGSRAGALSTTRTSTNFVICVDLPTNQESSHWILMGTALLMQLSK